MKKLVFYSDGCVDKVSMDESGTFKVKAVAGYYNGVNLLFKMENTGNGYKCKCKSYNADEDQVFTIEYDVFDYIGKCWMLEQKNSKFPAEVL